MILFPFRCSLSIRRYVGKVKFQAHHRALAPTIVRAHFFMLGSAQVFNLTGSL